MNINGLEYIDIMMKRRENQRLERGLRDDKEREFFNRCYREIKPEDAYDFLVLKASKLLDTKMRYCYRFVNYFFDNQEHFDCSFTEGLTGHNGPLVRSSIYGLFPEFELITNDKYEIAEMAREHYGIEIYHSDEYDDTVYSFEFDFRELNKKRVNLVEINEKVKEYKDSLIKEALEAKAKEE